MKAGKEDEMIFVQLKQNGVLCRVTPHPIIADRGMRSSVAEFDVLPRHNAAIAAALGHGQERRRPNGGYGLKCLRGRAAKDCLAELKTARAHLENCDDSSDINFTAFSVLNLLIWWADANPDAVFSVT
jgi:hypothetical protein